MWPRFEQLPFLIPLSWVLSYGGFALAVVLAANLLRSNRSPSSTFAWLLAIILVPYVGVPLYLMFGGRKIRRMAARKRPVYAPEDSDRSPQDPHPSDASRILQSFGVPPATPGNLVTLVTDGVEAYHHLFRLIDSATTSIHVTTYILADDLVGRALVARLAARASEAVEVRVLLDDIGSFRTPRSLFDPLLAAGGRVSYFMPMLHVPFRGRTNLRNHRKSVVIDGRVALAGGMNIAREYMGPTPDPARWRDVAVVVEGPAARDLQDIFLSDWAFATHAPTDPDPPTVAVTPRPDGVPVQVVASGPDVAGDPLYESLVALLFAARRRIWVVTPYFVPDEILARALEFAARRGVDVRLVIPNHSNHKTADLARYGYLRQVHEAGGKLHRYRPTMLHAKLILIDDALAVVGSANMDMRSLFLNYEVALFLDDTPSIRVLDAFISSLFPHCKTGLARRNLARDLAENIVRLFSPLL